MPINLRYGQQAVARGFINEQRLQQVLAKQKQLQAKGKKVSVRMILEKAKLLNVGQLAQIDRDLNIKVVKKRTTRMIPSARKGPKKSVSLPTRPTGAEEFKGDDEVPDFAGSQGPNVDVTVFSPPPPDMQERIRKEREKAKEEARQRQDEDASGFLGDDSGSPFGDDPFADEAMAPEPAGAMEVPEYAPPPTDEMQLSPFGDEELQPAEQGFGDELQPAEDGFGGDLQPQGDLQGQDDLQPQGDAFGDMEMQPMAEGFGEEPQQESQFGDIQPQAGGFDDMHAEDQGFGDMQPEDQFAQEMQPEASGFDDDMQPQQEGFGDELQPSGDEMGQDEFAEQDFGAQELSRTDSSPKLASLSAEVDGFSSPDDEDLPGVSGFDQQDMGEPELADEGEPQEAEYAGPPTSKGQARPQFDDDMGIRSPEELDGAPATGSYAGSMDATMGAAPPRRGRSDGIEMAHDAFGGEDQADEFDDAKALEATLFSPPPPELEERVREATREARKPAPKPGLGGDDFGDIDLPTGKRMDDLPTSPATGDEVHPLRLARGSGMSGSVDSELPEDESPAKGKPGKLPTAGMKKTKTVTFEAKQEPSGRKAKGKKKEKKPTSKRVMLLFLLLLVIVLALLITPVAYPQHGIQPLTDLRNHPSMKGTYDYVDDIYNEIRGWFNLPPQSSEQKQAPRHSAPLPANESNQPADNSPAGDSNEPADGAPSGDGTEPGDSQPPEDGDAPDGTEG